jgi:hypothetical protein
MVVNKFLLVLCILSLASCSTLTGKKGRKKEVAVPYEIPPNAPIPPEKYCYQLPADNRDAVSIELNVEGDSVSGQLYLKPENRAATHGTLVGQVFGKTIFLTYHYQGIDGVIRNEQQEWKFGIDSLVKKVIDINNPDTLADQKYLDKILYLGVMHKVPCK